MHIINMLNHIILANMFHSLLWPSSEYLITIVQLNTKMYDKTTECYTCHIEWEPKQVEKCTGMLKYTVFPKSVFGIPLCPYVDLWHTCHIPSLYPDVIQSHSVYDSI